MKYDKNYICGKRKCGWVCFLLGKAKVEFSYDCDDFKISCVMKQSKQESDVINSVKLLVLNSDHF